MTSFPILDFSKFKLDFKSFADEIFDASNEWGFFILTGHGIKNVDRIFQLSRGFFDLPAQRKSEKLLNSDSIGYDGNELTSFAASEGISFGTPSGGILETENLPSWWDLSKREEIETFKADCARLSAEVMCCFAVKLGLDKKYFSTKHHSAPGNTLKLIKYPCFDKEPTEVPRLSEHTDWGSITFVFSNQPGLEVRDPHNQWYDVPLVPGGIVVNIADALSLWTNKSLKSTMHRISWNNLDITKDRYSIAYFTNPDYDAVLSLDERNKAPKNEPPLTYCDYYKVRQRLTWGSLSRETFEPLDSAIMERVRKLNVANSGLLVSHDLQV